MAHSLSAKKRVRQNIKRRARNRHRKELVKTEVKAYQAALAAGDVAKAEEQLNKTVSRLDKVAAKGAIHKNTAARKRSRMARKLNALRAGGGVKPGKTAKAGKGTSGATA